MGLDRLTALWHKALDSLWFLPSLLTAASAALAFITIQIDVKGVLPDAPAGVWLFSGTASGARGVLTAIASGLITVTGVVFSVTIVALQLASTQFTPRILRNFTADRANQLVLGVFIGTFTYALLVLRVVRGEQGGVSPEQLRGPDSMPAPEAGLESFVPSLSVTTAVVLTLVSIGFLIFFIDHAARSVQASTIIDRVTRDTRRTLDKLLPERVGVAAEVDPETVIPKTHGTVVAARMSGYIQGVDIDALFELIAHHPYTIRMDRQVGHFVLPGVPLATLWPAGLETDDQVVEEIHDAFVLGPERTPHLDPELGVIELVDIAVKALSPGINDPTTATLCVDRLTDLLLIVGDRDPPARVRRHDGGGGVLVLPATRFERFVELAFDQIRHYGIENARFTVSLLDRLDELGGLLPAAQRVPLERQAAAIVREARERIVEPGDRTRVEEAGQRTIDRLRGSKAEA